MLAARKASHWPKAYFPMFETAAPHIFALPPGADFPAELVAGLRERMAGKPPEAMGRVMLYLNTSRMRRRVEEAFRASAPGFLPKLLLVSDLARDPRLFLPAATSPLRRRLELTTLIAALLDRQPDVAPRAALYDLADSLATLMDEMQGEGVSPEVVADLDVSNHSQHWARTQAFLKILTPLFAGSGLATACRHTACGDLAGGATAGSRPDRGIDRVSRNDRAVDAGRCATAARGVGSAGI